MPKDDEGYSIIAVFIDRFSKKAVIVLCRKTATIKDLAEIYVIYCYRHLRLPDLIVLDRRA